MADSKTPLKIQQSDLVGDCLRLNRRFELDEGRISGVEGSLPSSLTQPQAFPATSSLTLTTAFQEVPGMSCTLTKSGWWRLDVTARLILAALDATFSTYLSVSADGIPLPGVIIVLMVDSQEPVVSKPWLFKSQTGAEKIIVYAKKTGGTGASAVEGNATQTTQTSQVMAFWVAP